MLILDIAIVNVALPSMQRTLGLSAENIQWVVGAYALTFGGFLMLGGRLADVVGRRRLFLTGLVLFIGASMLGGFSQSGGMLIAARVVQGFAGALVSPAALSLLTTTFKEGRERNRALGMWSAMAAGGASAGLILGGLLTQELSWRFTLFVNAPLGLAAVLLSPVLPADAPRREAKVSLDIPGAVSLTGGVIALAYGVTEATGRGFASTNVLIALPLSAALLIAFVVVEKTSSQPLLPARMLRLRSVVAGNSVAALVSVVMIGAVFFNSLYLQEILGYSPIQAGLAWLPQTVLIMVVSNIGARIATKLGARILITVGTLVLAAGMLLFLRTAPESDYVTVLLPAMLVTGIGIGLALVSVTMAATSGVPDRDQGIASGLIGTAQQVGMAVGLAILVNIAGSVTRGVLPARCRCRYRRIPSGVCDRRLHQLRGGHHRAHCDEAFFGAAVSRCGRKGVAAPDSATQRRPEPVAAGEVRTLTSTGLRRRMDGASKRRSIGSTAAGPARLSIAILHASW